MSQLSCNCVHLLFSCNVCTCCFLATCAPIAFLQCVHLFLSCILQRVHLLLSCNVCTCFYLVSCNVCTCCFLAMCAVCNGSAVCQKRTRCPFQISSFLTFCCYLHGSVLFWSNANTWCLWKERCSHNKRCTLNKRCSRRRFVHGITVYTQEMVSMK